MFADLHMAEKCTVMFRLRIAVIPLLYYCDSAALRSVTIEVNFTSACKIETNDKTNHLSVSMRPAHRQHLPRLTYIIYDMI